MHIPDPVWLAVIVVLVVIACIMTARDMRERK